MSQKAKHVFITGNQGQLQLIHSIDNSPQSNRYHRSTAVICHPHPLYGGSMQNKIVTIINKTLNNAGIDTVRFNFPGVEQSDGKYLNGIGEVDDLISILSWLQKSVKSENFILAGFSFGAYIAAQVAANALPQFTISKLILVAPPVSMYDFSSIDITQECIVIQGGSDTVVNPDTVRQWVDKQIQHNPNMQLHWFDEAEHFFHGKLNAIANTLKNNGFS